MRLASQDSLAGAGTGLLMGRMGGRASGVGGRLALRAEAGLLAAAFLAGSASERPSRADRSLLGSTVLGPPRACTPV